MNSRSIILGVGLLVFASANANASLVYSNLNSTQNIFRASTTLWDDVTIVGGGVLSEFRYEAYNALAPGARTMTTQVSIHLFDGLNNLPNGAFLGTFSVTTPSINAGSSAIATRTGLESLNIVLPTSARLGVRFDFTSNSGIILHSTPTVGFSQDILWRSFPPVTDTSSDVDNLGFSLTTITAVPEPGSLALVAIGALGCVSYRRKSVTSSRSWSKRSSVMVSWIRRQTPFH